MAVNRRAVFIDKDGTLLEDRPYNVDPAQIVFTPGALEGLGMLADAGFALVVVSNQSGVARGYFDRVSVEALLSQLQAVLATQGLPLLGCYYCPHHPAGVVAEFATHCDCRKPLPGMVVRASREHGLDPAASYFIGDILDDVEAGHRAGCRSVLLDRGSETEWRRGPYRTPDFTARDLRDAARWVVADSRTTLLEGAVVDVT
ncbi:MAG TPA: HAD family hydrolase [Dehalococcoidia bacterium]|jgi:D,D-heptose 1,7-bisphosphate phosphatase|nr:HAD family hydrolase [Dehalococcoidia bacterium]